MIASVSVMEGDWIEQLKTLPDESVHCCVTSPPYWGLRDYGTAKWEGGDAKCNHKSGRFERGGLSEKQASNGGSGGNKARSLCPKCGAVRIDRQLGLEKTPEEYVAKVVSGFREVRRVLRDDGTSWVNLGDSYGANYRWRGDTNFSDKQASNRGSDPTMQRNGWPSKQMVGIPWRVAFALQADGWYLRSDIIWHKPNPMPESVTDRPTKSHEYIFLLSKKATYFYDAESIKEPLTTQPHAPGNRMNDDKVSGPNNRNGHSQWETSMDKVWGMSGTRNKRSVWTVTTSPYKEAHFATFPPDLIKPCILAGCPAGGTVLDPFGGSGTTGMVAMELGRSAIMIELNPDYVEMIHRRTAVTAGLNL